MIDEALTDSRSDAYRFVQDEESHVSEVDLLAADQFIQSTRCGNDDVHTFAQHTRLFADGNASNDHQFPTPMYEVYSED